MRARVQATVRTAAVASVSAVLSVTAFSAEDRRVPIGQHALIPAAAGGDSPFQFHPKGQLDVGYDSNVRQQRQARGSVYAELTAGLNAQWYGYDAWSVALDVEASVQDYTKFSSERRTEARAELLVDYNVETTASELFFGYSRIDSFLFSEGRRADFDEYQGHIAYEWLYPTDTWRIEIGALRIEEDGQAGLRDESQASAELLWELRSPTHAVQVRSSVRARRLDDDRLFKDGDHVQVEGLVEWSAFSNLRIRGGLGVAYAKFDDDFAGLDPYDDAEVVMPLLTGEIVFGEDQDDQVRVAIESDLGRGTQSNANSWYRLPVEWRRPLGENTTFKASATYGVRFASGSLDRSNDSGQTFEAETGLSHILRRGLAANFEASWVDNAGDVGESFSQFTVSAGIAGVF